MQQASELPYLQSTCSYPAPALTTNSHRICLNTKDGFLMNLIIYYKTIGFVFRFLGVFFFGGGVKTAPEREGEREKECAIP